MKPDGYDGTIPRLQFVKLLHSTGLPFDDRVIAMKRSQIDHWHMSRQEKHLSYRDVHKCWGWRDILKSKRLVNALCMRRGTTQARSLGSSTASITTTRKL